MWDEKHNHWWFSVPDIVGAINQQDDHEKKRNYWKYLKAKLRKEQSEVVSNTTQLKLTAANGKKYNIDVISLDAINGFCFFNLLVDADIVDIVAEGEGCIVWRAAVAANGEVEQEVVAETLCAGVERILVVSVVALVVGL